jgi:hypothetical protein
MTLSDLASLGSVVSGIAVLVSLVFLYFQMRQMTEQVRQSEKNQRAAVRQGHAAISMDYHMRIAEGHLTDVFSSIANGAEKPELGELRQFLRMALALFLLQDEMFEQYAEGLISERHFAGFVGSMKRTMSMPGMRVAWRVLGDGHGDEFRAFVEKMIAETPLAAPLLSPGRWSAELAHVLAAQAERSTS